ncbi:hypothetical protein RBG61_01035 [Paludicola sp. MB14-C6]|nr:hypothetical protein [Paludicola sp. MB14-C6]WMJ23273.1 hypothetical protein RBG61_01035 [Paludicola sp. MB14-C6]
MKCLMKIICFIGGILVLAKLAQIVVDVLYNHYGKKYIIAEEIE